MAAQWKTLDENERGVWRAAPLEGMGSLKFGMAHEEVEHAVREGMLESSSFKARSGHVARAEFILQNSNPIMPASSLSTYYGESGELAAVAVDARSGPQVVLDGLRLVGRVPSELKAQFSEYVGSRGLSLLYSEYWDPSSEELGIVLRVQRVDDVVLSRPVFVCEAWAERCGDSREGKIPSTEWNRFSR
ncbi:hypothetical protein [Actinacidiphila glaucinigra]|uniref:hypothetical protein n=1 Tax=Actinacidiphila glaucinigra TaxID=235986 RepID=UPI00366B186D